MLFGYTDFVAFLRGILTYSLIIGAVFRKEKIEAITEKHIQPTKNCTSSLHLEDPSSCYFLHYCQRKLDSALVNSINVNPGDMLKLLDAAIRSKHDLEKFETMCPLLLLFFVLKKKMAHQTPSPVSFTIKEIFLYYFSKPKLVNVQATVSFLKT